MDSNVYNNISYDYAVTYKGKNHHEYIILACLKFNTESLSQ